MTKKGSNFGYMSSHVLRRRVSIGNFCEGECLSFEECSEDICIFFLFFSYIVLTL